jgi:GR25 family glycosyltransferase involved in LPS biosynthesis
MTFLHLNGDIRDHLKKAENKSGLHQIRNVDFIYMINLDQRPEKFEKSLNQLTPYGIYPYRFSAVNGWELTLQAINDVGVKFQSWMPRDLMATTYLINGQGEPYHEMMHDPERAYFCYQTARGTIGIFLSHLSVLQDAYDSGYETIWVMEDDICVRKDPNEISDIIARLDRIRKRKGWDILFTDCDIRDANGRYVPCIGYASRPNFTPKNPSRMAKRQVIGPDLRSIGARFGATSMIVRRSGMKKILDFVYEHKIFLPYDMEWQNIYDLHMFTVLDDIVTNLHDAISDNGLPYYKQKENGS